jgi:hypothetical protein
MRLNGSVHIGRNKDLTYSLSYAPLGVASHTRPVRVLGDRRELGSFLADQLKVDNREINTALGALVRNGSYSIWDVWLSEEEIAQYGLGPVWSIHSAPGALSYHPALA